MKGVFAIAKRDLAALYFTLSGWVILAAWGLIAALIFTLVTLQEGEPASMRAVIAVAGWGLAVLAPAVSMRAFAEESRQGTLETLLSAPISSGTLVLGKYLACVFMLLTLGVPVLLLALVAEGYGRIDPGELGSGLIGLLLLGMAMTSVGVMVSTRTSSQVVAYLVTFFAWFALVVLAKGLPAILPQLLPSGASVESLEWAIGFDPLVRLDEFALGLFDTGNVAWFLAITVFFLVAATISLSLPRRRTADSVGGRFLSRCSTTAFLLAVAICAGSVALIFESPALRVEADLTKTRAYSLGPATRELLEDLQPEWSIRLLVSEDTTDPVTLRLIDEVLKRMDEATPSLKSERIDPSNPDSVGRYEAMLESLLQREEGLIQEWNLAIKNGLEAFESLRELGKIISPKAAETVELLREGPIRAAIERVGETLGTVSDQGSAFEEYMREALESTAVRPLPDWVLVQTSLIANNELYASELEQLADLLRRWSVDTEVQEAARAWAGAMVDPVESTAIDLLRSTDELKALKPLEVSRLSAAIAQGDAAIIEGPMGAMVIPSWQLFPASAVTGDGGAVIGFDRRFRGEETLAASIRALRSGSMPRVVFVHPEERSMLRPRDDGLDVSAVADALKTARIDVLEWMPGQTARPGPALGEQPTVWLIMPPMRRTGIEYDQREKDLIEATSGLIAEGEPVLFTPARSLLPLVGLKDPWSGLLEEFGVSVDTGRVVFEWSPSPSSEGESGVVSYQVIDSFPESGGSLSGALRGKRLFLNHPTPIRIDPESSSDVFVVAEIEPTLLRFIEDDWRGNGSRITRMPEENRFEESQPAVVGIEHNGQRVLVVGSGGWLLSALVNDAGTLGGDRVVLRNPGNRELALSGVAWLAGMDELVATAASGREVSRFVGITATTRLVWGIVLPLVLGVGPLLAGGLVWSLRRRTA